MHVKTFVTFEPVDDFLMFVFVRRIVVANNVDLPVFGYGAFDLIEKPDPSVSATRGSMGVSLMQSSIRVLVLEASQPMTNGPVKVIGERNAKPPDPRPVGLH
jgi:hypothetical protein